MKKFVEGNWHQKIEEIKKTIPNLVLLSYDVPAPVE